MLVSFCSTPLFRASMFRNKVSPLFCPTSIHCPMLSHSMSQRSDCCFIIYHWGSPAGTHINKPIYFSLVNCQVPTEKVRGKEETRQLTSMQQYIHKYTVIGTIPLAVLVPACLPKCLSSYNHKFIVGPQHHYQLDSIIVSVWKLSMMYSITGSH